MATASPATGCLCPRGEPWLFWGVSFTWLLLVTELLSLTSLWVFFVWLKWCCVEFWLVKAVYHHLVSTHKERHFLFWKSCCYAGALAVQLHHRLLRDIQPCVSEHKCSARSVEFHRQRGCPGHVWRGLYKVHHVQVWNSCTFASSAYMWKRTENYVKTANFGVQEISRSNADCGCIRICSMSFSPKTYI